MFQILITILPLFLIIAFGFVLQKVKIANQSWITVLNNYALHIGLPILIFLSLYRLENGLNLEIIWGNILFLIFLTILVYITSRVLRWEEKTFRTILMASIFGNIVYLGVPVMTNVLGEVSLPETSLIIGIHLAWMMVVGVGICEISLSSRHKLRKDFLKNIFLNPLILSVILGLIFFKFQIPILETIEKTLEIISAPVTYVVLLVIGIFMGTIKIGRLREWGGVLLFSIFLTIILPALFFLSTRLLSLDISIYAITIIEFAMPAAITPFILAEKYKLNAEFIARTIVLSTIISVITLPIWISFVV